MTLLRKPVSIVLIGSYYLISPFLNLIQIAWITQLPLTGPVNLWNVLHPLDWAILFAFPVVGWGMLAVKRWGWVTFTSFSIFLIAYNTFSFIVNRTYNIGVVILYNLTLAAVTFVFFRKHLRAPYFNPRLRWWNADPRYPVKLSADIPESAEEAGCEAEILDISKSGVFLSACVDVSVGQTLTVVIHGFDQKFAVTGKVMRKTAPNDPKPGFGLMFERLDNEAKNDIRLLLAQLIKNGARERGLPADAPSAADPFHKHLVWYAKRLGAELVGA